MSTKVPAESEATIVVLYGRNSVGEMVPIKVNDSGHVLTAPAPGTSYSSPSAEASKVVSTSACSPARFGMLNGNAGTRYVLLFNATSLPANGAIPVDGGSSQTSNSRSNITLPIPTDRFSAGLVIATSSTSSSLTIGSADALFSVDLYP